MSKEIRTPDLNSERTYRFVESTKVYLYKITFNLRTLIYHVPRDRKFKKVVNRYRKACAGMGRSSISLLPAKMASETAFQCFRYNHLKEISDDAKEKYSEYYDDLSARLACLKSVKSFGKWKITSEKRRLRMYNEAREAYTVIQKDRLENINRLLSARARVLGARKDIVWKEYLKTPDSFDDKVNEFL